MKRQIDIGMAMVKLRQSPREIEWLDPVDRSNPDSPTSEPLETLEFVLSSIEFGTCPRRTPNENFPGLCQPSKPAVEHLHANLTFEIPNSLADGRLCHVEFFGDACEVPVTGKCHQIVELS